jgi:hypothetical protein
MIKINRRNCIVPESPPVDLGSELEEPEEEEDLDNVLEEIENWMKKNKVGENDTDQEDGPDWMFEDGETSSKDPNYVFCPAAHRAEILRLFTKHFCQHPLFPERLKDGNWDAKTIRRNAVWEMYTFCYLRGLREVWGYLWTSWYSPKRWELWARSTSALISRLRTTMNVEAFWKVLRHNYLHDAARPRLDQLVWILIHEVTPTHFTQVLQLDDLVRAGRSRPLTTYQKYMKTKWKKLESQPVSNKEYDTSVPSWTCNCGSQKYDCHSLCKHLVQRVGTLPARFWQEIYRRRTVPIYRHPELVDKALGTTKSDSSASEDDSGTVTDGDDHLASNKKPYHVGRVARSLRQSLRPGADDTTSSDPILDGTENSDPVMIGESEDEEEVSQAFLRNTSHSTNLIINSLKSSSRNH